ncbi:MULTISPECIES: HNH endonuclease signature motif containing protein [Helicobacter]|uniref:HNH endonuclease n=4 Tax=Helicobacter ganmani TaxID=60246 RepID=A0A3D8IE44_9HELI|nr:MULTISPECIES: HNH endonuclease signature motif containing protein [Helicobacter]RDU62801.1 HNH endonuclease [Helicobacter ganmani]
MKQVSMRHKRKDTELFFDSFKHFKHNLSNLIGVELPTLYQLGVEQYLNLISTNYKSKYPDMRKIGLIEYDKPSDYSFSLTSEAQSFMANSYLIQNIYSENDLKAGRKNIDSLPPNLLIQSFVDSCLLDSYQYEILKLILSYYDTADLIRPYLALLNFVRHYEIQNLSYIILQDILAQTKENILLMRYDENAFNNLDLTIQNELKRPISYIYNFLQTALVVDSNYNIIVNFNFVDRLQIEMNNIVFAQPTPTQNNSRPAREQRLFRENVLKAYDYQCAITGQSIFIDNRVLLEAAHIIPYRDGGSFAVSNGIALSYEMHKIFDNGLFGFVYDKNQNLRIKVSSSHRIVDKYGILNSLDNRIISIPHKESEKPDSLAVEYNLEKYLL